MGAKLRVIKSILKPFKNPTKTSRFRIPKRLRSANDHVLELKLLYLPKFEVVKADMTHKTVVDVPNWFTPITQILALYLDVYIIRDKVMKERISPVYTFSIIGEKAQVLLAAHYIDYLFNFIDNVVDSVRAEHKTKARSHRRRGNRGANVGKLVDTRTYASNYRNKLIREVESILYELLEYNKTDHEIAFNLGVDRQGRINDYLKEKYSRAWKTRLFNKGS